MRASESAPPLSSVGRRVERQELHVADHLEDFVSSRAPLAREHHDAAGLDEAEQRGGAEGEH